LTYRPDGVKNSGFKEKFKFLASDVFFKSEQNHAADNRHYADNGESSFKTGELGAGGTDCGGPD
ncbi:MAG: hypothetical protein COU10_01385, partial [Candidatus Harrisonbacteria bacterium CG10_big_fil_rev_8_21_14_0_10_45_28]